MIALAEYLIACRACARNLSGAMLVVAALVAPTPLMANADPSPARLAIKSSAALVMDESTGQVLFGKNADLVHPIASITKLMTAMVVLDARLDLSEPLQVTHEDIDQLKGTTSRLHIGSVLTRDEMLRLALMASENRAASALGRHYPGGLDAFIAAMNQKALQLGLMGTRYADPTGLSSSNVSTAEDLARLVREARRYDLIRAYSTATEHHVSVNGRTLGFRNTNGLVASPDWDIGLSKTGFIAEAGRCLVMQAKLAGRAVVIVLLDSWGKYTRTADAARIRRWLEVGDGTEPVRRPTVAKAQPRPVARKAAPTRAKGTGARVAGTSRRGSPG